MKKGMKKTLAVFFTLVLVCVNIGHLSVTAFASDGKDAGNPAQETVSGMDAPDLTDGAEQKDAGAGASDGLALQEEDKDAASVETSEKKEDEIKYPAADWTGETADLNVFASVGEGVFPEGTKMQVGAVDEQTAIDAAQKLVGEDAKVVDAVAADITFLYNGEEIQPKGNVHVNLVAKKNVEGDAFEAITVDDSGNAKKVADANCRITEFDTPHFTVYGIAGTEYRDGIDRTDRIVYQYHTGDPLQQPDTWPVVRKEIHTADDRISTPADPSGDGTHVFDGWYIKDYDGTPVSPAQKIADGDAVFFPEAARGKGPEETDLVTVNVYATFDTRYKVTFYSDGRKSVLDTKLVEDKTPVNLLSMEEAEGCGLVVGNGKKLVSWKNVKTGEIIRIDGPDGKRGAVTVQGEDIDLVPVYEDAHRVTFNLVLEEVFTEKLPYQIVANGETITMPPEYTVGTEYKRYEFGGWYKKYNPDAATPEEQFKEPVDFANWKLSERDPKEIVLYAKWIPKQVEFTVTPFREKQNEADYDKITDHSVTMTWNPDDGAFPIGEILIAFPDDKYVDPDQSVVGKCHLSGNGALDGVGNNAITVNGEVLPAVQVFDRGGNEIAAYRADGTLARGAEPTRDNVYEVRVNYNRDRYYLRFLYVNDGSTVEVADLNKLTTIDGITGSVSMNPAVPAELLPEGISAGYVLPQDVIVKHSQHLYRVTHLVYNYGAAFDPFMATKNWYFTKHNLHQNGETMFDETHQGFPVKPTKAADGGEIVISLKTSNTKKTYVYISRYYEGASTWADVKAGDYTKSWDGKSVRVIYLCNAKQDGYLTGHSHSFELGKIVDGYMAVAVTGHAGYRQNKVTTYPDNNGEVEWSGTGIQSYSFYAQNGYWDGGETGNANDADPIIIHHIPVKYRVTFKQTKDGSVNGIAVQTPESDREYKDGETIYFGTSLADILEWGDALNWNTLTDARGVTFTADGGWKCDFTDEEGNFPSTMPAQDLVFYKEWKTDTYQVTYDYAYPVSNGKNTVDHGALLPYGSRIPDAEASYLEREDYTLTGWAFYERKTDAQGNAVKGEPIPDATFNTAVTQDLYIVAQWRRNSGFRVEYRAGDYGTFRQGSVMTDPKIYAGSVAPVNYIPVARDDYVFVGYRIVDKNGTLHDLADSKTVRYDEVFDIAEKDAQYGLIALVAQYERKDEATEVTYHANYPDGTDLLSTGNVRIVNKEFRVAGNMFNAPAGYRFVCWTNDPGTPRESVFHGRNTGHYFFENEWAAAGRSDNHLYALWEEVPTTTTTTTTVPPVTEPEVVTTFVPMAVYYPVYYPVYVPTTVPVVAPVAAAAPAEEPDVLGERRVTVTVAEEPAVLGSVRTRNTDEPEVLGSRRGVTGEEEDVMRVMMLMAAGVALCALARKKEYA